jgi:hypothetical protein
MAMNKQARPRSTAAEIDVVTPSLGPVPVIYIPIRRERRSTKTTKRAQ